MRNIKEYTVQCTVSNIQILYENKVKNRVGHCVLFRSERSVLFRSFKEKKRVMYFFPTLFFLIYMSFTLLLYC